MNKKYILLSLLVSFMPLVASASFNQNLYYGLRNNADVSRLQQFLKDQGVYSYTVTGNFFSITLNAVKVFQKEKGIIATGFVGPITRAKINSMLDGSSGSTVTRQSGDKEFNFLVQKVNQDSVDGLWYIMYPVAMEQGQPKTLHIGDMVGYTCTGKTAILVGVDVAHQTATFKETITNPPPYGCPI